MLQNYSKSNYNMQPQLNNGQQNGYQSNGYKQPYVNYNKPI